MATVVTCPSCGADAPTGTARWCGSCGTPLDARPDPHDHGGDVPAAIRVDQPLQERIEERSVSARQRGLVVLGVIAVVVVLLALQTDPSGVEGDLGSSARGDAARSGVVAATAPAAPTEVVWRLPLERHAGWNAQQAAATGGRVVVSGANGVSLHDPAGQLLWHRPDLHVHRPVAAFEDVVVVFDLSEHPTNPLPPHLAAEEGRLVALDLADGATRWSDRAHAGIPALTAHPAGLVILDRARTVTLLDPATGERRWTVDGLDDLEASIRTVFVGADPGVVHLLLTRPAGIDPDQAPAELVSEHLAGIDAASGRPSFEVAADRETFASQPLTVIGDVIAGVDAERLWLWDARDGRLLSSSTHGTGRAMFGVSGGGDTVVIADATGGLTGFDIATGARRWSERIPGAMLDAITVAGDDLLVPTEERMSILNLASGQLRGTLELPVGGVRSAPDASVGFVVVANGSVTVHTDAISVRAAFATPAAPWPEPIVRDGRVAVATAGEVVLADAGTGEPHWRLALSSDPSAIAPRTVHPPAVTDETLVVSPPHVGRGEPDEGLIGLDLLQSVVRWDRTDDEPPPSGPLTLADDTVFLPQGTEIHGHDTTTGRRVFAARAGHPRGAVAAHAEYVFATSDPLALAAEAGLTPTLVAVRRLDRSLAWEEPVDSCATPTVAGDLVLTVEPAAVSARDVHRGDLGWSVPLDRPGCLDLAVAHGMAVAAEGRTTLVAIDTDSGDVRWRQRLPAGIAAAPTIAGETLLVPQLDGSVAGLELASGEQRWSFPLGEVPASSVTVTGGRYVVVTRDSELVAFGA